MTENTFFSHFYDELLENKALYPYYKLAEGSINQQQFRKAYFIERLKFINSNISRADNISIFDCGCGYGTTALFFAMNNISVRGITLEFYHEVIDSRIKYWSKFGDANLFNCEYQNIFDINLQENSIDYIILQDTLHHLEPPLQSLHIFYKALKKGGKIILIEENGNCIIQNLKLYKQRGNKRVIEFFDEKLNKTILMGNENIRSQKKWMKLFETAGFKAEEDKTKYIRLFPPQFYKSDNLDSVIKREETISKTIPFIKKYGFFGLNMVFYK